MFYKSCFNAHHMFLYCIALTYNDECLTSDEKLPSRGKFVSTSKHSEFTAKTEWKPDYSEQFEQYFCIQYAHEMAIFSSHLPSKKIVVLSPCYYNKRIPHPFVLVAWRLSSLLNLEFFLVLRHALSTLDFFLLSEPAPLLPPTETKTKTYIWWVEYGHKQGDKNFFRRWNLTVN